MRRDPCVAPLPAEPAEAADLSGLVTTVAQLSAVGGVAVWGTIYLALTGGRGGAGLAGPAAE